MGDSHLLKEMGKRVCARRQELQLTQEQVAERMDVSIQMVSNLELGKKAIRPENFLKLCGVLNISADYILSGRHSTAEMAEIAEKFALLTPEHQKIMKQLIESLINEPEKTQNK